MLPALPRPLRQGWQPLASPSHRVDHVHSTFPSGRLAHFDGAAQDLEVGRVIQKALSADPSTANLALALALNQIVGRQPFYHLHEVTRPSLFLQWEVLDETRVTPGAHPTALMTLYHPLVPGFDNAGLHLQERLNQAWHRGSREPTAVYYDITQPPYYGTECPYVAVGHDGTGDLSNVVGFGPQGQIETGCWMGAEMVQE